MKVSISTIGTFHHFDLARELAARGKLSEIYSAYPHFKLRNRGIPSEQIKTYPWVHAPYMAIKWKRHLGSKFLRSWERLDRASFDSYVSRRLDGINVFVGLSGSALLSGRACKSRGVKFVLDRGSSHIRTQDRLLREENELWGMHADVVDPWVIEREEAEYSEADCITVPSTFNVTSFLENGIPIKKIKRLPYGVDLARFYPSEKPKQGHFDVLFAGGMSLRKGVPYLLQAYQQLQHPRKSLTFAGTPSAPLIERMKERGLWSDDIRVLGHLDQAGLRDLMSKSHVLVLPSIEEGLALVQAQAMACGCPVIATEHTGAGDLFTHGQEGFICKIREAGVIAEHLQMLSDDEDFRVSLGTKATAKVQSAGGWRNYGDMAIRVYEELLD